MLTSGKHDIAHIASSVYFSQPRAGFFLSILIESVLYWTRVYLKITRSCKNAGIINN